jgi:replicative DNA helicase
MTHELEQAVIASVLRDPLKYDALRDILSPDQFGWECYGSAWKAIGIIQEQGLKLDAVILADELDREGKLKDFMLPGSKQFSGRSAISAIREIRVVPEVAESYAHQIADYDAKKKLKELYTQAVNQCLNGRTATDIISDVESQTGKMILHGKVDSHTYDMHQSVPEAVRASEEASKGKRIIETGLEELDKIINVQRGELITVAAPTGQGKTALLATIVLNSSRMGQKWQVFALEGGATRFTQRLLSQASGVDAWRIMNGKIQDHEMGDWYKAIEEVEHLPIFVTDIPNIRIGQIRIEARKRMVDAIAVDYVQLASADKRNERRDLDIGEVTRGLSALATERDIPIFQAAQIDRSVEKRSDRKPTLSDLRESGSIENDSATVIMLYRPDALNQELVDIMVMKHRNGALGTASARFTPGTMRFSDVKTTMISVYPKD